MADELKSRTELKAIFSEGAKPSDEDFSDFFFSFVHLNDDNLSFDGDDNLVLSRGIQLGNSASTTPGTLRFNGTSVEFFDGAAWTEVGGGSAIFSDVGGGDVTYDGGNVGIGTFASNPTHALDVSLGENTGPDQRARFGNVICSNGPGTGASDAYFYHQDVDPSVSYALRQRSNGEVRINAASNRRIRFQQNNSDVNMCITPNGNVVVGNNSDLPSNGGAVFQVNGAAFKNNGQDTWDNTSDIRVKEDIRELEMGLEEIKRIRPVRYRYTGACGTPKDLESIGVVGQEIEKVIPETVKKIAKGQCSNDELDDLRVYNSSALTYVLVNSVKELSSKLEEQAEEIMALKKAANKNG